MDVMMERMSDGFDLSRKLKKDEIAVMIIDAIKERLNR